MSYQEYKKLKSAEALWRECFGEIEAEEQKEEERIAQQYWENILKNL